MVMWSSSSGRAPRRDVYQGARPRPIPWWLRTGALLTVLAVMRFGRTVRAHVRPAVSLAGTVITVIGISLPSEAVLISGFLVLLLALFLPSDPAAAPAKPCSARLWASPVTPFSASARRPSR
jgi:hypothetical protein